MRDARVAKLRAAARPFAALLQPSRVRGHEIERPDEQPVYGINGKTITLGDLRRLNEALAAVDRDPYVTTTTGMSGHFAVMMHWNEDNGGFWEPLQTGIGRYATRDEAVDEGRAWADAENVEFLP